MITLEELKTKWTEKESAAPAQPAYDPASLEKIMKHRVHRHTKTSFQYFWASFALQVLVYSLLSHVIVKYWQDTTIVGYAIAGVLLFLPFTIMLMRKFKGLASTKLSAPGNEINTLYNYVLHQQTQLRSFYNFKRWYELILTPLSAATGIVLTFLLYVPGGVEAHWTGAIITFVVTLLSCIVAIRSENKKSFEEPIGQLQLILDEFKTED